MTAEPGGNEFLVGKLAKEGLELDCLVHSDPELRLHAKDASGALAEFFVHGPVHRSRSYLDGVMEYEVEPALAVVDSMGNITMAWSWLNIIPELKAIATDMYALETASQAVEDQLESHLRIGQSLDPGLISFDKADFNIGEGRASLVNVRPLDSAVLPAILTGPVAFSTMPLKEVSTTQTTRQEHYDTLQAAKKRGRGGGRMLILGEAFSRPFIGGLSS